MMIVDVDDKFLKICSKIMDENLSETEWSEIESDDQFYELPYCGGFDALENAFCFGYYAEDGKEFSIQLTLSEISKIVSGEIKHLNAVDLKELDDSRRKKDE